MSTVDYFDDEQPEDGQGEVAALDDDHQTDLEEPLESQHYAFGEEDP